LDEDLYHHFVKEPVSRFSDLDRDRLTKKERDFYSHKAGNQNGHAHQTWCLVKAKVKFIYLKRKPEVDVMMSLVSEA